VQKACQIPNRQFLNLTVGSGTPNLIFAHRSVVADFAEALPWAVTVLPTEGGSHSLLVSHGGDALWQKSDTAPPE